MNRVRIVIVDRDQAYLKALNNYFFVHKIYSFDVMVVSNVLILRELLATIDEEIELLLINSQLICEELDLSRVAKIIPLLELESKATRSDLKGIYKYQSGDKLVNDILEQLIEVKTEIEMSLPGKDSETKFILHTSPAGGAGTTSVCISTAAAVASLGQRALYLNFEGIPSQQLMLHHKEGTSLSSLYYALKKKSKNIALRLEANKTVDVTTGLSFLAPPDSLMDIDELQIDDIKLLLEAIKQSKGYDYVFIDSSSQFNNKNKLLMEECDYIALIIPRSQMAFKKAELLEREFASNRLKECILRKITIIENEYPMLGRCIANTYVQFLGKRPDFVLPVCDDMLVNMSKGLCLNMDSEFMKVISSYAGYLINSNRKGEDYGGTR